MKKWLVVLGLLFVLMACRSEEGQKGEEATSGTSLGQQEAGQEEDHKLPPIEMDYSSDNKEDRTVESDGQGQMDGLGLKDRDFPEDKPEKWVFETALSSKAYLSMDDFKVTEDWSSFGMPYYAEQAQSVGLEVTLATSADKRLGDFGGDGYVGIWDNTDDVSSNLTFTVQVQEAGTYDLVFISAAPFGDKYNHVTVNGTLYADGLVSKSKHFEPSALKVSLMAGSNQVVISESWGWFYLNGLIVRPADLIQAEVYRVEKKLSDPKATEATKSLMSYLVDQYGQYTLAGQYQYEGGILSKEFKAIYQAFGRYPAIMGLDLIDYSPTRVEHGTTSYTIEDAILWHKKGGIVTLSWHWNAPKDLIDTKEMPWWKGFYTEGSNFDLKKALDGRDPEGFDLLIRDIDAIGNQLKRLSDENIPVLWRPLHEASGGWFWWGASGAEAYQALWKMMYDRLVTYHGLHNLIWVYNAQDPSWYPGDGYVDIIGEDIYPPKGDYSSQRARFESALSSTSTRKLVALTENGVVPDPNNLYVDKACWLFFATWNGEFLLDSLGNISSTYTDIKQLEKVYYHKKIITLDELPDLSTYPGF